MFKSKTYRTRFRKLSCSFVIIFLLFFNIFPNLQALPSYWQEPYTKRLDKVDYLTRNFSGRFNLGSLNPSLSLWGGIYVQTLWQLSSNRDSNILWALVNSTLSIEPYLWSLEFKQNPRIKCEQMNFFKNYPEQKDSSKIAVCQSWLNYFIATQKPTLGFELQRVLWRAHLLSINDVIARYGANLTQEKHNLPSEEYLFWQGWVELVGLLSELNFPTQELFIRRLNDNYFPDCFPLGATHCQLNSLNSRQYSLASILIYGGVMRKTYLRLFLKNL